MVKDHSDKNKKSPVKRDKSSASLNPWSADFHFVVFYVIPFYAFLAFMYLYDFSSLACWYWLHNYRLQPYSSGDLTSISRNPFLSSIPDYSYNPLEIYYETMPTDTMCKSYITDLKPNRIIEYMKPLLNVVVITPVNDNLTTNSWLQWSVRGTALDIPDEFKPFELNLTENMKRRLERRFMLDVQLNNYKLNIPNADVINYQLNGLTMEMRVDLATYNITHGAHEVRVSILMLESPFSSLGNITASEITRFYYLPESDLQKSREELEAGAVQGGPYILSYNTNIEPTEKRSSDKPAEIASETDPFTLTRMTNIYSEESAVALSLRDRRFPTLSLRLANDGLIVETLADGSAGEARPSEGRTIENWMTEDWKHYNIAPFDGSVYKVESDKRPFEQLFLDLKIDAISLPTKQMSEKKQVNS